MKGWLVVLLLGCLVQPLCAQWKYLGIGAWGGISYDNDDLFFNNPVLAWRGMVDVEYGLRRREARPQYAFLSMGVAMEQRGTTFEMDFPYAEATRKGNYFVMRLAVPLRLGYHLPLFHKDGKQTALSFWFGPSVSVGLMGKMEDAMSSQRYDAETVNYERSYAGRELFEHVRRLDVSMAFGSSYRWEYYSVSVTWEMGLVPSRRRSETQPFVNVLAGEPVSGHFGLARTLLVGLDYHFKLRGKIHPSHQRGAIFM